MKRIFGVVFLAILAITSYGALNLDRVSEEKIFELINHFRPYLSIYPPHFPDRIMRDAVTNEARETLIWLKAKENWPKDASYELLCETARLSSMFHMVDLEGAAEFAIKTYQEAIKSKPNRYEAYLGLASFYAHFGPRYGRLAAENAEKAIELNPEAAEEDGYTIASLGYYYSGEFKKAYEAIKKSLSIVPESEIARSIKEGFDGLIAEWGYVPEKIEFRPVKVKDARGLTVARPMPIK